MHDDVRRAPTPRIPGRAPVRHARPSAGCGLQNLALPSSAPLSGREGLPANARAVPRPLSAPIGIATERGGEKCGLAVRRPAVHAGLKPGSFAAARKIGIFARLRLSARI
jgi:hypothetical protein